MLGEWDKIIGVHVKTEVVPMPPTLDIPIAGLSVQQRLDLIDRLWMSLEPNAGEMVWPEWHREEVRRRIAEADAFPEAMIPLETLRRELLADRS